MYMLSVTIAASDTPQRIIPKSPVIDNSNTGFQTLIIQSNGAEFYIGDSTVSATTGIHIGAQGSITVPISLSYVGDLKDFYVSGTAATVIIIMVIP